MAGDLILVEADSGQQVLAESTNQTRFTQTIQDCYSCVSEMLLWWHNHAFLYLSHQVDLFAVQLEESEKAWSSLAYLDY